MSDHSAMQPYRIVIADDHSLIRQGIKSLIRTDPSLQITGEAGNGLELLELLETDAPDLVILDLTMPLLNGFDAIERISRTHPGVVMLVLSMHGGSHSFYRAIAAGAHGYVIKDDSDAELLTAIRTVRAGEPYISPQLAPEIRRDGLAALRDRSRLPLVVLSDREKEVLRLVVQGYSSRQIAELLDLSPRTIDHHRANLVRKFGLRNTVELVHHVARNGFLVVGTENLTGSLS